MWPLLLIAFAAVMILFVIIVTFRSNDFYVNRSLKMKAPQSTVFEQVNDPHHLIHWNPWLKLAPTCKQAYENKIATHPDDGRR